MGHPVTTGVGGDRSDLFISHARPLEPACRETRQLRPNGEHALRLSKIGPGLLLAATGVGAGDLATGSIVGSLLGTAVLWAVLLGAFLKFVATEGLARWQLATGTTLLEGWVRRLPRFWSAYFFVYLLLWSFIVAGALMSATGLAVHALVPAISVEAGGAVQSLLAALLVLFGRYRLLEAMMKFLIALMFAVVLYCAVALQPDWGGSTTPPSRRPIGSTPRRVR